MIESTLHFNTPIYLIEKLNYVDIIDEVNKYAVANRMKTFAECLKHCRGKLVRDRKTASKTSAPNPKKPKKDKPVEESKEEGSDEEAAEDEEDNDEEQESDGEYLLGSLPVKA
jgi:hypothetical protein